MHLFFFAVNHATSQGGILEHRGTESDKLPFCLVCMHNGTSITYCWSYANQKKNPNHLFYERNVGFCCKYLVWEKSSETGETTLASGAWVLLKMQFSFITYCIFTPTTTAENLRNTWLNEANPCRGLADISNILLWWSQRESFDYWQSCRQRWNLKQQTALVSCKVKIYKIHAAYFATLAPERH